ncbi:chromate transporter [bacterium D16-54]|nr:chromate transporter [bacterium D16-54]RKJ16799.1 chromate transporter [bacterium D16-56]
MKNYKKLPNLVWTFFKIGLFTFGGGYAMIALIEDICVEKNNWITHDEMITVTAIAESTPGPIAINCATFVGLKQAGLLGAASATIGIVLPSFVIIFAISRFLKDFLAIPVVSSAFHGIKIAVGVLIVNAAATMIKKMPKKRFPLSVMISSFLVMLLINFSSLGISSICLILTAAAVSLAITAIFSQKGGKQS